jgi:hypothetical protein
MRPERSSTFRAVLAGALVGTVAGCNAILGNDPAVLDADAVTERGAPGDAGAPERADATQDEGASRVNGPSPHAIDASDASARAEASGCAGGSKACGDLCVSREDPYFGCSDTSCARCVVPNATAGCAAGACVVAACTAGFGDCNANPSDGCETDLASVTSCGACGVACPVLERVAMACVNGACTGVCETGFADCNDSAKDGCEVDLLRDRKNCGACGMRCVFGRCHDGVCRSGDDD